MSSVKSQSAWLWTWTGAYDSLALQQPLAATPSPDQQSASQADSNREAFGTNGCSPSCLISMQHSRVIRKS